MSEGPSSYEGRYWPPVQEEERTYLDETSLLLPGWPGYRNRPGRIGLDPLDSEFELAHMQGRFIRALITGRLRTNEATYLILMAVVASFSIFLFSFPLFEYLMGGYVFMIAWCYSAVPGVLGILLFWNLVKNLRRLTARSKR